MGMLLHRHKKVVAVTEQPQVEKEPVVVPETEVKKTRRTKKGDV